MRRFATGLLVVVSALALLLSSTSLWVRQNVIDTGTFVSNVEKVVDAPAVRNRISEQVATAVLSRPEVQDAITQGVDLLPPALQRFRPSVESGVASLIATGVQGVLTAEPFRPLTRAALTSAQQQLVAGQPVRFSVGQAKRFVPPAAQSGLAGQVLALVPNDLGVTLLTPSDAPQLYTAIDLLQSVWWWTGLLALLALAGALLTARKRRAVVIGWAATTAGLAALLLLAVRIVPSVLLPQVQTANRAAVSAAVEVFTSSLRIWTVWLGVGALVLLVGALLWGHLGLAPALRRAGASARRAAAERRAAYAARRAEAAATGAPEPARDPWYRRAAATTRAWWTQLDLPARLSGVGAFVRAHLVVVRWAGVAVGALLLLLWPSPTIGTLIWVGALVALYLAAVAWLESRAARTPAELAAESDAAAAELEVAAVAEEEAVAEETVAQQVVAEQAATPVRRSQVVAAPAPAPASPAPEPAAAAATVDERPAAAPEPAVVPAGISHEALTTLNERLDLLVRLEDAKKAGVLTEEEFSEEKEVLLRR